MRTDEVFSMCISPGYWVACSACASAHRIAARFPQVLEQQLKCARCENCKSHNYFASPHALAPWCRKCELQRDLEKVKCDKCRKVELRREFLAATRGAAAEGKTHDLVLCLQCCPEHERYMCTVCKVEKNRRSFPEKTHLSYKVADMRRCLECYTCAGCGEAKEKGHIVRHVLRTL